MPLELNSSKLKQKPTSSNWTLTNDLLFLLIAFRILNALVLRTFFQPDEYYQALEPAWQLAFGDSSGAWITWEWKHHLRSAIHPAIFSIVYSTTAKAAEILQLSPSTRAQLFFVGPKIVQSFVAALGDYYTVKLAERIYGAGSKQGWVALTLTTFSSWQWFCSTRTFSNCLETTLTTIALYHWPFHWALTADGNPSIDKHGLRIRHAHQSAPGATDEKTQLRRAILLAGIATILRPTNVLIWLTLLLFTSFQMNKQEILNLLIEGTTCSGLVLAFSGLLDRLFYGTWTFPAWNFLYFNVFQSLAIFYGNNNWHYYLSQGYPLLLTAALPFSVIGLIQSLFWSSKIVSPTSQVILHRLAVISIILPAALSVLAHKEVRFIYPLLPALHVLAALPFSRFLGFSLTSEHSTANLISRLPPTRLVLVAIALFINVTIAFYTSLIHNSGLIALPDFMQTQLESYYTTSDSPKPPAEVNQQSDNLTFAVLMPCHSVPWRSHLQYPPTLATLGISGWALTCEPPLDLTPDAKAAYLDEADVFYEDPLLWIKKNMSPRLPPAPKQRSGVFGSVQNKQLWGNLNSKDHNDGEWLQQGEGGLGHHGRRAWPSYLIFFEQLESTMQTALRGSAYFECARFFNSHFHDDWRRTGDVVVWCLHPERKLNVSRQFKTWNPLGWAVNARLLKKDEI